MLIAGAMALPVTGTLCWLSAALSVMINVAARAGGVTQVGLKMTLMVQVAPMATVAPGSEPQLLV